MVDQFDGDCLKQMIICASQAMEINRQAVNELNVFPVPDGDTGTNMSLTLASAAAELAKTNTNSADKIAETVSSALIRGARGNSGVILSLLFRGFSRRLKNADKVDGKLFAEALSDGVDSAYKAVMKPAEGTILTVSREAATRAGVAAFEDDSVEYVLEQAVITAAEATELTIEQNPVLKKAGVIDAGARGFVITLEAMLAALRGEFTAAPAEPVIARQESAAAEIRDRADFASFETGDIKFGYCTELFINTARAGQDVDPLRTFLDSIGDSLVLVDDETVIKIHVHTNNPGSVLEKALEYGALTGIKIENMREQHTKKISDMPDPGQEVAEVAPPERKYGFAAVSSGDGLRAVFLDLGADSVIEGGQSMNPSTQDILKKVNAVPAEIVFVLPNNKNIILAAEQCVPLTEKQVVVVPTRSIPEGIAAMLAFDPSLDCNENTGNMNEAVKRVTTVQVTYAVRDAELDGQAISEGDYLTLLDGKIVSCGRDLDAQMETAAGTVAEKGAEFITIFHGSDVTAEDAERVGAIFRDKCDGAEVSLLSGGQPVYYYIISAE